MKESELAKIVLLYLKEEHWDVYQEVRMGDYGSSVVDLVAKSGQVLWGIEIKMVLNLTVIAQAYQNIRRFHYSSIAVPMARKSNGRDMAEIICRQFGIGIIEVNPLTKTINTLVMPKLQRKNHSFVKKYISGYLYDEQKSGEYAGAGSDVGGYFTPYKRMMRDVKCYIHNNPGCALNDIMKNCFGDKEVSYMIPKKTTLRLNLKTWESDWCEIVKDKRINRYYIRKEAQ